MLKPMIKNLFVIKNWPILVRKFKGRLDARNSSTAINEANNWCKQHASSMEDYMNELDPELFKESIEFSIQHKESTECKLRKIEVHLGGGGAVELLYFLIRLYEPMFCIETGVAAGHSSAAILSGLKKNSKGLLFSSDLPYFRIKDPNSFIGILVDEDLKDRWFLATDGDQKNLLHLPKQFKKIDFLHYDSDKYYEGRKQVFSSLNSYIKNGTIIVMDDIQDNLFFKDFICKEKKNFKVFNYKTKYIGLIIP